MFAQKSQKYGTDDYDYLDKCIQTAIQPQYKKINKNRNKAYSKTQTFH